jgi:hypothetical protein
MTNSTWSGQPSNKNFLSPTGFKFNLNKAPKVDFYSNAANIPAISLGSAIQTRYGKNIDIPGDKMSFGDFNLRFLVDENLENYLEIWNWMTGLGFPYSLEQYDDLMKSTKISNPESNNSTEFYEQSDATLQILSSNFNPTFSVKFTGMYPTSLSSLEFDATEENINYFTAQVNFKYTYYKIIPNL